MEKIPLTHKPKPDKILDYFQSSELNVSVKQPVLDNDIQMSIACMQLCFGKCPGPWFPVLRIPPSDRNSQLYKYRVRNSWLVLQRVSGVVMSLSWLCCDVVVNKEKVMVRQIVKSCLQNTWNNPFYSAQQSYSLSWELCYFKKDVGQLSRAQIIQ